MIPEGTEPWQHNNPSSYVTHSPSTLHSLSLVQTGLNDGGQPPEPIRPPGPLLGLGPRTLQTPHPFQGQQGVQTNTEVMAETPLENNIQGLMPLYCLVVGDTDREIERRRESDTERETERERWKERDTERRERSVNTEVMAETH